MTVLAKYFSQNIVTETLFLTYFKYLLKEASNVIFFSQNLVKETLLSKKLIFVSILLVFGSIPSFQVNNFSMRELLKLGTTVKYKHEDNKPQNYKNKKILGRGTK